MLTKIERYKSWLLLAAAFLILLGIWMRLLNIAQSDFVFYDEGYYINDDRRQFVDIVERMYPLDLKEFFQALYGNLRISLGSGKALWIFLINSRVAFHMPEEWYFSRIISSIFGCLTLWITYLFANQYFRSRAIGILSAVVLAVLPSHVFYSRLGMQEALSTFCFLLGFYFYLFPRRFGWRTFLSSVFFMLAYFTNYRLVVIPALVAFCEMYTFLRFKEIPDYRKYIWNTLGFLLLVFGIGSIDKGQHLTVILPWMWHQAHLAGHEPFHWFNLFSYPYFTFRLETFFFGFFFWANLANVFRKKWDVLYPFFQAGLQMLIFSFPEEKGARYICVVYPFMAMAVASFIVQMFEERKEAAVRVALVAGVILLMSAMTVKSWALAHSKSDYREAMGYLTKIDPNVKVVSSQKWIVDLYTKYPENVEDLPHTFPMMLKRFSTGYRYLILDPQAYVSWGTQGQRFSPELDDYLNFLVNDVPPVRTFPNFNDVLLERFVLEHNENLMRSIHFLALAKDHEFGEIRVYDMAKPIEQILKVMIARDAIRNNPTP